MNVLDVRTVLLSDVFTDALCTVVLVILWVQYRTRFKGTLYWVLNFAFQTGAGVLIILRGVIPEWVSVVASNMLIATGGILAFAGLGRFVGRRTLQSLNYFLPAAFVMVHLYFAAVQPNLAARTINTSVVLLLISTRSAWLMLHRVDKGMRGITRGVGLVNCLFGLVSAARIVGVLAGPPAGNDFFSSSVFTTLSLMAYQLLLILLTFALALMVSQRLFREVQTQEEKFAKAFLLSPFAIMLTRPSDGLMREVNGGFVAMTGYTYAEAVGKTTLDLRLWVDAADGAAVVAELDQGKRVVGREYEFRKKSGELLTGVFSAEIIAINDEPCILASINDISERKWAEAALQKSEDLFSKAFHGSPAAMTIARRSDGAYLEVNESFLRLVECSREEVIGHTGDELRLIDSQARAQIMRTYQETGTVHNLEIKAQSKSGRPLIVLTSIENTELAGQDCTIAIMMDIRGRKRAEEELRRQTERLRSLHDMDQAILLAADSPQGIVQSALRHLRSLLGCQRSSVGLYGGDSGGVCVFAADIQGETTVRPGSLLAQDAYGDPELLRKGATEVSDNAMGLVPVLAAVTALQAEGAASWINVPLLAERGLIGALNVAWTSPRSISVEEKEIAAEVAGQVAITLEQSRLQQESKRYSTELEQRVASRTAQLEAANKELEAFAFSVSHDLRAPLRAIDGFTRILAEDYEKLFDAEGKRVCAVISQSARDMGRLIDDLLAFSRVGRAGLERAPVDMAALAQAVFLEVTTAESRERIDFLVGSLPPALGDLSMLHQCWVNLLSNAVKFSSRKERAVIEVSGTENGGQVTYCVRDNGAGFDMAYADKLFGVFQRLHSPKEFEGTGVGLAIVQRIVNRHGGRIWAEGETGAGASFHFTIGMGE